MSDRIAVMDQGRILQIGTPVDIYERPASRFIAEFIGESNLLNCNVLSVDGPVCSIAIGSKSVTGRLTQNNSVLAGQAIALLVRPEMIRLHALEPVRTSPNCAEQFVRSSIKGLLLGTASELRIRN